MLFGMLLDAKTSPNDMIKADFNVRKRSENGCRLESLEDAFAGGT